jgi:signal transduction histidine kinase
VIDVVQFTNSYKTALLDLLHGSGEVALSHAYDLGRGALAAGMGVLDVAAIQHEAFMDVARSVEGEIATADLLSASQSCLVEALAPFEITYRGSREAISALHHFNDMLENEIKRMAHTLHGETGQLLAAIHMAVGELHRTIGTDVGLGLRKIETLLRDVGGQLRRLSHEVRPTVLDDFGLCAALEFLRDGLATRTGLTISVEGPSDQRYPQSIETVMYRVAQEALNNVVKHADASTVAIRIEHKDGNLVCAIADDGKGFSVEQVGAVGQERGFGLIGMRERLTHLGGSLRIESSPEEGTRITATIPLSLLTW